MNDKSEGLARLDYELLDFGAGRKLERFGEITLDRSSPAAENVRKQLKHWEADCVLDSKGRVVRGQAPDSWGIATPVGELRLKLTPFGHVGLFPEQVSNWSWLRKRADSSEEQCRALNLFAYTGASSLAMSHSMSDVTHVDASAPTVAWARKNAKEAGYEDAVIRWLVEDARVYVQRALRRGKKFDLICLDPPSYGHSPKGKVWRIESDLLPLLAGCLELLADGGSLLLTGHSEHPSMSELADWLTEATGSNCSANARRLQLTTASGRGLDAGFAISCDLAR